MIVGLRLQHFRSYADASFEFGDKVNIIVGPNGSGKTNLLEAIQVVAIGSSYRVHDADLVQNGAEWARIDAGVDENDVLRTVKIIPPPRQAKTFEINEKSYTRLTHTHTLPIVLFEPNHLQLLHGSPDDRRAYLDDILEQIRPGYQVSRRNYRRILFQRNTLLKRGRASDAELFPWNLRLSELGAAIARARTELVHELAPKLHDIYRALSSTKATVEMTYQPQFPISSYETGLLSKLEANVDREIERGFTAYGPHREDFMVTIDGRPVAEVASRGETRTIVLGLKILELELIERARQKTPLLLLDDVFSELDGSRRRLLTDYLQTHQTFLTTTDADVVVKHFTTSTILPLG